MSGPLTAFPYKFANKNGGWKLGIGTKGASSQMTETFPTLPHQLAVTYTNTAIISRLLHASLTLVGTLAVLTDDVFSL